MKYFYAGGVRHVGTTLPSNVMGDCPHRHRSPESASACIDKITRQIKSQPGGRDLYCDRIVMVYTDNPKEWHPTYGAHFPYKEED